MVRDTKFGHGRWRLGTTSHGLLILQAGCRRLEILAWGQEQVY